VSAVKMVMVMVVIGIHVDGAYVVARSCGRR